MTATQQEAMAVVLAVSLSKDTIVQPLLQFLSVLLFVGIQRDIQRKNAMTAILSLMTDAQIATKTMDLLAMELNPTFVLPHVETERKLPMNNVMTATL